MLVREREDLFERARNLDAKNPDMILSIHHDAVQDRYLKQGELEGKARTFSDKFAGYSIFVSYENPRREDSRRFATMLGEELRNRKHQFTMHHSEPIQGENRPVVDSKVGVFRYDHLVVLRHVKVPAVLLEAAVIVNPEDESRALDPTFRAEIAQSVVAAVERYCIAQQPLNAPLASQSPARN
jgi:N-acetylmuramoyl-L-alanine amidase